MPRLIAPLLLFALAACGQDADPGPAAVTADEERALDEAAEMIEAQRLPADMLRMPAPATVTATPAASAAPASR